MSKPICVINYNVREIPAGTSFGELYEIFKGKLTDYHVLLVPIDNPEEFVPPFDLKVFYEKDFTEIQYAELKKIIEDALN